MGMMFDAERRLRARAALIRDLSDTTSNTADKRRYRASLELLDRQIPQSRLERLLLTLG